MPEVIRPINLTWKTGDPPICQIHNHQSNFIIYMSERTTHVFLPYISYAYSGRPAIWSGLCICNRRRRLSLFSSWHSSPYLAIDDGLLSHKVGVLSCSFVIDVLTCIPLNSFQAWPSILYIPSIEYIVILLFICCSVGQVPCLPLLLALLPCTLQHTYLGGCSLLLLPSSSPLRC